MSEMRQNSKLKAGDWVEVRSKEEILRTLDKNGQLDGLPFMPEMFAFCGCRFRVFKSAHKTCDTVFPVRGRRMSHAVHLDTRCDGQAHGGCHAGCLLFWKTAWLKPVEDDLRSGSSSAAGVCPRGEPSSPCAGCSEQEVLRGTRAAGDSDDADPSYVCQATQLPYATTTLASWDLRQYVEDYTSGNVGLAKIARGFIYMAYRRLMNLGIGLGASLRWFYDLFQRLWGGPPYPRRSGKIATGGRTPSEQLELQPGERVRVKSYETILATCDQSNKNRGMFFDAEMVPYCGGTYRVLKRVSTIINEQTGKMQVLPNPCIILDGVVCQSRYSECRLFCPRSIYQYWREIWLERVEEVEQKRHA